MDVERNGGRLFRRLTVSCSAEKKEGKNEGMLYDI
jgi:hypothetical protein